MINRTDPTLTFAYPLELESILDTIQYKPGWSFHLLNVEGQGLTMRIDATVDDSYAYGERRMISHLMPVPPLTYNRESWQRWVLDQIVRVETHESCEFFIVDGVRPYAPNHGHDHNAYVVIDRAKETT